jgi:hypothetical protein
MFSRASICNIVRSEKMPVASLSIVDLPSLARWANSSREMRSRAM